jgi:hypothetical protein
MAPCAKSIFLASLCSLSLAAELDCTHAGSCFEDPDQTSLVQVKQVVRHGSERTAPAEEEVQASSEKLENKEGDEAETQDKDEIPFVVGGKFVGAPMAAAVGASLGREAAANAAANAVELDRAAVERGQVASMAAAANLEAQPMHPNLWPTPVVNWKAIADATPDGIDQGEVTSAFGANQERAKETVIGRAARNLAFQDKVHDERRAIKFATARSLRADKILTMEAIHRDRIGVAATEANRLANVGMAIEEVNAAKEEALAHTIKQKQAQSAALMGRMIGAKEGAEEAFRVDAMMKHKWAIERAATVYAAEKRAARNGRALERAAVEKDTAVRDAEMDVYAARHRKEAEALAKSSASDASLYEDDIAGPEGMKNTMELHEADRVAEDYARMAGKNKEVIADLTKGADRKAVEDDVDQAESKVAALEDDYP